MCTPQSARGKYNSMSGCTTGSEKLDVEKLLELSTSIEKQIQALRHKEVTLVVGKTGSGKSTLINYLLKNKLTTASDDTGKFLIQLDPTTNGKQFPQVGGEFISQTSYPKYFETEKGLLLCDTAGFGDNRSLENNAAAYLAVQMIIQSVALIKGVIVVVSADDFKGRATGLNETLSLLKRLIMFNENCVKHYRNSVVFVFTHAENKSTVKIRSGCASWAPSSEGACKTETFHFFSKLLSLYLFFRRVLFSSAPEVSTNLNLPLVKTDEQIQNLIKKAQHGLEQQRSCNPNNEDIVDSLALCNIMLSGEVQVVVFDPLIAEHKDKFRDKSIGRDRILNFIEQSRGIVKEDIAFRVERIFQQYSDTFCEIANSFLIARMAIMYENSRIHEYEQKCENAEREISKLKKANADIEQYSQKNVYPENLKDKLKKTNDKIISLQNEVDRNNESHRNISSKKFHLEKDTTLTLVNAGEVYSENDVHGAVNKGVVKTYTFVHSADYPIARIDYAGGHYKSTKGTRQKFSTPIYGAGRTSCKIKYEGPSHEYGHAEFYVYCEKKLTSDSRAQLKHYENELEAIEKELDDIKSDLNKAKVMGNNLSMFISRCIDQNLKETKKLLEPNKKIIEAHNKERKNVLKTKMGSTWKLMLAKMTVIEKRSQYQMLVQLSKIVPFEEPTIQEFICKYKYAKTTLSAAASSLELLAANLQSQMTDVPYGYSFVRVNGIREASPFMVITHSFSK